MNLHKKEAFKNSCETIMKNLSMRGISGYYFDTIDDLHTRIQTMVPKNATVSWGGSETLKETKIIDLLNNGNYNVLDRSTANTPAEKKALYGKIVTSDYFFMSSNAVTLDGELVNIDGSGNRVACLIHGPENVIVIIGMNKIAMDVESAIKRIQNVVAPANALRLNKNTPCYRTGQCGNCFSADCMCSSIVITRKSNTEGRIKVFFVADTLGY